MICFNGCRVFSISVQSLLKTSLFSNNTTTLLKYCTSQSTTKREKWDLLSAVSLERKPIIARDLNQLEQDVFNMISAVEYEKSFKSNHELQLVADKIKLEQLKKGNRKLDLDSIPEKSAQDFEDASQEEIRNFKFASRKTQADEINDVKSIERCLDRNLLLLVKEKIGKSSYWVLPQGPRQEGETLRQTAERVLLEKCGTELKADFFGNAPIGIYKYRYPKNVRENNDGPVGAKVFFFKAQLQDGNINSKSILDYQWATRKELNILPRDYHKSVTMFLIDEEH